ncbi:MAG: retroviral-like aspartic protease family protein [Planctomycetes bacterium]|nr:retroviral-like aspartic protease family protein [Planctomycetota bacterium]
MVGHLKIVCGVALLVAGVLLMGGSAALAADLSPHEELLARGLSKKASYYVVPSEIEFSKRLPDARKTRGKLSKALKKQADFEHRKQEHRKNIREYVAERMRLANRLASTGGVVEQNRLIARLNFLNEQVELYTSGGVFHDEEMHIAAELGRARQEFVTMVAELRALVDKTDSDYAAMAANPGVQSALDELSKTSKRPLVLGPRSNYARNLKQLAKMEQAIVTKSIKLHLTNGVLWLDVSLNGRPAKRMVFDTGASMVTLPFEWAADLGLHPTENDPVARMSVADGRTVRATRMTLDSVRVGDFEVRNVACVVMPDGLTNVPPLLGQAFLRHFISRFDAGAGELHLSRVDPTARGS